jgi:hypothetical protein
MKPDGLYTRQLRWIDDPIDRTLRIVDQYGVEQTFTQQQQVAAPIPTQSYDRFELKDLMSYTTYKTTHTNVAPNPVVTAALGKLDELIAQLSEPSGDPGSDEYEDGFNACLALVVEFRDELLRGAGRS